MSDDEKQGIVELLVFLDSRSITPHQAMTMIDNIEKLERQLINTLYFCGRLTGKKWKVNNLNNY